MPDIVPRFGHAINTDQVFGTHRWLDRHVGATHLHVEHWRDAVQDEIKNAGLSEDEHDRFDELWRDLPEMREIVRPVVAEIGETAQFLAAKRIALTNEARDRFLDNVYGDLAAALARLSRLAEGNYSVDGYRERFAKEARERPTALVHPGERVSSSGRCGADAHRGA